MNVRCSLNPLSIMPCATSGTNDVLDLFFCSSSLSKRPTFISYSSLTVTDPLTMKLLESYGMIWSTSCLVRFANRRLRIYYSE